MYELLKNNKLHIKKTEEQTLIFPFPLKKHLYTVQKIRKLIDFVLLIDKNFSTF